MTGSKPAINRFVLTIFAVITSLMITAADCKSAETVSLKGRKIILSPQERQWLKDHPVIRVSGPRSFPPFYDFDTGTSPRGISVDYINTIADYFRIKLVIDEPNPWPEVLKRIQEGKIDLIVCLAKTPSRSEFLKFTQPYLSYPLVILTRKDAPFIGGVEDLHHKKLTIIKQNMVPERLTEQGIEYIPYFVTSPLNGLKAVSFGSADAHIENLAAASYMIQKNGLTNIKIAAPTPFSDYKLYMAARGNSPELINILNKSLSSLTTEQHNRIRNKHLSIRYEFGISKKNVFQWIFGVSGVSIVILGIVFFWNHRLKKEIENHQRTAKKLVASEKRFRQLIEQVSEIAIQGYDEDRRVTFWNKASEILYGYKEEEALGEKLEELIIPEEMKDQVRQHHHNWLTKNEKIPAGELELIDKNGKPVPVFSSHVMHMTEQGKEMFCIDIDLMPIREAQKALKESEKKYRHLFNSAPAGMYEVDIQNARFISFNDVMCKYLGYTHEELMAVNPLDLLTPQSQECYLERLEDVVNGENTTDTHEYDVVKKNGEVIHRHDEPGPDI